MEKLLYLSYIYFLDDKPLPIDVFTALIEQKIEPEDLMDSFSRGETPECALRAYTNDNLEVIDEYV